MPFQITPEIDFSSVGLITDVPAHALPQGAWNDCLNVRVKDGSVEGVNSFTDSFTTHASYSAAKAVAVTQWTPAGSSYLNIAYILKDTASSTGTKGRVFIYNTQTSAHVEITNANADANFEISDTYPPQLFVFNGLLICNPGTGTPQYISADETTAGNLVDLPHWVSYATGNKAIARIIRPFKNRLVAMSFLDNKNTSATTDDVDYSIDFAWSSHITGLNSLSGAEWVTSFTNKAGDAFLTETPGKILDGGQLGDVFVAYKSDSVVRVYETGDNFILGFASMFEDDGIYSTRCFTNIGNSQHLVIGNYGVYIHDGQSQRQDIAKGLFQDTLFDLVQASSKDRAFVFQQTRDKEVWFCFKSVLTSNAGCDRAFVFNYSDKKVHIRSLPDISDLHESELNGVLKIFAANAQGNTIKELSSTLYETGGWFIRKSDSFQSQEGVKEINEILIKTKNQIKIAVVGSASKLSDSALYTLFNSDERLFNPADSYKIDARYSGRFMNLRVTMSGTINPELTTLQFGAKISSRR
jgi:hypothetical protein